MAAPQDFLEKNGVGPLSSIALVFYKSAGNQCISAAVVLSFLLLKNWGGSTESYLKQSS